MTDVSVAEAVSRIMAAHKRELMELAHAFADRSVIAILAEREECARVADKHNNKTIAKEIRGRQA